MVLTGKGQRESKSGGQSELAGEVIEGVGKDEKGSIKFLTVVVGSFQLSHFRLSS